MGCMLVIGAQSSVARALAYQRATLHIFYDSLFIVVHIDGPCFNAFPHCSSF